MNNALDLTKFKASSLGTTVDSDINELDIEYKYSWAGWFFINIIGTTQVPKSIMFKCKKSNKIFETLTDKDLISHYIFYSKR